MMLSGHLDQLGHKQMSARKGLFSNETISNWAAVMQIPASRILCCGGNRQIHTDYRNPVEKKGLCPCFLSQREGPETLPGHAFIVFLGTLHQEWSSFTMHRFVLGGYLLQPTRKRMLLNTSKDICKSQGKSGPTGYTPSLGGLAQILGS